MKRERECVMDEWWAAVALRFELGFAVGRWCATLAEAARRTAADNTAERGRKDRR